MKKNTNSGRRVISITHMSDIDGIGSAALLKMKYDIPDNRQFFADYSVKSLEGVFGKLKRIYKKGDMLVIADLGLNKGTISIFSSIVKLFKNNGGRVAWFDHHPWSGEAIEKVASLCDIAIIGENRKHCATEITHRELGFTDNFTKNFARVVHYSDFNIRPKKKEDYETVGTYALSIAYYNTLDEKKRDANLHNIVNVLCSGKLTDRKMRSDAIRFDTTNKKRIKGMLSDLHVGKVAAVGFSKDIQSTSACAAVMKKSRKDVALYINIDKGRGHIRSKITDCSSLAVGLGGGGHPHAAGFDVDMKKYGGFKTEASKEEFLKHVEALLSKKE